MVICQIEYWDHRLGPFPLNTLHDYTALNGDEEFWRITRRKTYRAKFRARMKRVKIARQNYEAEMAFIMQQANSMWGTF